MATSIRRRSGLVLVLTCLAGGLTAQDMSGFWLGVNYPNDPTQATYNYTMTLTQNLTG